MNIYIFYFVSSVSRLCCSYRSLCFGGKHHESIWLLTADILSGSFKTVPMQFKMFLNVMMDELVSVTVLLPVLTVQFTELKNQCCHVYFKASCGKSRQTLVSSAKDHHELKQSQKFQKNMYHFHMNFWTKVSSEISEDVNCQRVCHIIY